MHRPSVPPELDDVVLELLAFDPASRPQSAEELEAILEELEPVAMVRAATRVVVVLPVSTVLTLNR